MKVVFPPEGRHGAAFLSAAAALLLLTWTLCAHAQTEEKPAPVSLAELRNGDTLAQGFDRIFRPRHYWQNKVTELEAKVQASRERFIESDKAYRAFLTQRRAAMREARAAVKPGQPNPQRREILVAHREESARLRRENREAQKSLRLEMMWLEQARRMLEKSR